MKEALIVGIAGALGGYAVTRWFGPIEAKAVAMHIPPAAAHIAVVASVTALTYVGIRAVI